jgi:hypothetical protein
VLHFRVRYGDTRLSFRRIALHAIRGDHPTQLVGHFLNRRSPPSSDILKTLVDFRENLGAFQIAKPFLIFEDPQSDTESHGAVLH